MLLADELGAGEQGIAWFGGLILPAEALFGLHFEGKLALCEGFDDDARLHAGIVFLQVDDVCIAQADASLAVTARNTRLIVRASVYADA